MSRGTLGGLKKTSFIRSLGALDGLFAGVGLVFLQTSCVSPEPARHLAPVFASVNGASSETEWKELGASRLCPRPRTCMQVPLGVLWPLSLLPAGDLRRHRGVSRGGPASRVRHLGGGQRAWACGNPWAEDAAVLGRTESHSSGALPPGAGAGATLGVVTELWPWAEQGWVVQDLGCWWRGARKRLLRCPGLP